MGGSHSIDENSETLHGRTAHRGERIRKHETMATVRSIADLHTYTKERIPMTKQELASAMHKQLGYGICAGIGAVLAVLISGWIAVPQASSFVCGDAQLNVETIQHFSAAADNLVAVNLGGWLCLEDWFHSGSVGRYVSTPNELEQGQGACLPPLLTGPLDKPWPSEGVLVQRLHNSGQSAPEIFRAFRDHFITEADLVQIAKLGIKTIRIPFSWSMFADALAPLDQQAYGSHDPDVDSITIPDPFHVNDIRYVTIPRKWFKDKLKMAEKHGLRVILDLHNMPGGSSDGTYSGVWPLRPAFWQKNAQIGNKSVPLLEVGHWVAKALMKYIETDLGDLVAKKVIWGVCFMNEPAHLSGIGAKWGAFATPDQVLQFVDDYGDLFRKSSLPSNGVRLYIQLIETAWASGDEFDKKVPPWYHSAFTQKERYSWAVMARHFYTAWGCNGMLTQGAAYQCDQPLEVIRGILYPCISGFAEGFASKFHGLRAVTEWSIGSHWDANMACHNSGLLRTLFEENVKAFAIVDPEQQMEPVFWSWKMPYGPKFENGWSLKKFSGNSELSDSNGVCVVGDWAKENPLNA